MCSTYNEGNNLYPTILYISNDLWFVIYTLQTVLLFWILEHINQHDASESSFEMSIDPKVTELNVHRTEDSCC